MATFPKKTVMPTAISNHCNLDLSGVHVTTSNFMDYSCARYLHVVPDMSVDINMSCFARFDPMPHPTFGLANIHHKCFFVPRRVVMPSFDDMITDTVHTYADGTSGIADRFPYCKNKTFVEFFNSASCSVVVQSDNCDYVYISPGGVISKRNLTAYGKLAMKILNSLGYKINFNGRNIDYESYININAFLSFIKIYMDYYYPSAYVQSDRAVDVEALFNRDSNDMEVIDNPQLLNTIFEVITTVNYDSDYYTSAWDNPSGPNSGGASTITFDDPTTQQSSVGTNLSMEYTPVATGSISHYLLTALRSVSDYMKRHQMAGSRAIDRFASRFGITLSSEKLKRSILINQYNQPVYFGDVTSMSDTEGAQLGQFAGKGISNDGGKFTFNSTDYGIIIIVSSIVPVTSYFQGMDRHNLHLTKLDEWTPEFDNLGVQGMSVSEVYMPMDSRLQYTESERENNTFDNIDTSENVFGFVPRYAEFKRGYDMLTGDFVLNSLNTGLEGYTMFRDVSPIFKYRGLSTVHSIDFVEGDDCAQYNRIFYNTDNSVDHIKLIYKFDIKVRFPGKSLFDNYDFENEANSEKVSIDVNGVKAN